MTLTTSGRAWMTLTYRARLDDGNPVGPRALESPANRVGPLVGTRALDQADAGPRALDNADPSLGRSAAIAHSLIDSTLCFAWIVACQP